MKKNIGIILAGGNGRRMGSSLPKQFLKIAGKTILEHSIKAFDSHPGIDEVAVAIPSGYMPELKKLLAEAGFSKLKRLLPGGNERHHSTLSALQAYSDLNCNLLIHDAVRPLVTRQIIGDVILALETYKAVNVAIPVADTIIEVDETAQHILRIPERSRLFQVQTPQGFDRQTLQKAFDKALQDPDFHTTDDCSLIRKYLPEEKIKLVNGDRHNLKLTWPEDLEIAEKLLISRVK